MKITEINPQTSLKEIADAIRTGQAEAPEIATWWEWRAHSSGGRLDIGDSRTGSWHSSFGYPLAEAAEFIRGEMLAQAA